MNSEEDNIPLSKLITKEDWGWLRRELSKAQACVLWHRLCDLVVSGDCDLSDESVREKVGDYFFGIRRSKSLEELKELGVHERVLEGFKYEVEAYDKYIVKELARGMEHE